MRAVMLVTCLVFALVTLGGHESIAGSQGGHNVDWLRGKTLQWTFADGPMAGTLVEHTFHDDGSVTWRILDGPSKGVSVTEKRYTSMQVAENVHAMSYLSASGHTLTVVLNLATGRMVGFGSNNTDWQAMSGTFEIVR